MRKYRKFILLVFLSCLPLSGRGSAFASELSQKNLTPPSQTQPSQAAPILTPLPPSKHLEPATTYFPILPYEASEEVIPQLLPLASNHPLDGNHVGLRHAIVIIHDYTRDAGAALTAINSLAGADTNNTLIIAPQFLLDIDIARFGSQLPENGKMFVRWPLDAWQVGGDSIASQQKGISSFTALDLLLIYLGEKKYFPDLEAITLVGHGTGGDFVQRYAAVGRAPDILSEEHVPLQFVVANASTYLYFTAQRPKGGRDGFQTPDLAKCPSYNAYPYGLENLTSYARSVGVNAIRLRYVTRPIIYLTGDKAIQNDPFPDMSCSALLEGVDRLTRAVNYALYLNIIFGDTAEKLQKFVSVPKAGYDLNAVLGSKCGMSALFGDGECK